MKILIIAEKPSLARDIQSMLTKNFGEKWSKKGDYFESQNYKISSFFGHLLQQFNPEDYDPKYKEWKMENLPIVPDIWKFKYSSSKGIKERGKLLKKMVVDCSSIINACDPDKEGEGIFRRWYEYEKINCPVKRLWSPSLADKDLKKSWDKLKGGEEYNNLYAAQKMRSYGDWLIGMNATPAYSIAIGKLMPIGRVMTATLGLIVKRDLEIENYKESYKYLLKGLWGGLKFTYHYDKKKEYDSEVELQEISQAIHNDMFNQIDIQVNKKESNPPKTYSQPELQKDADKKYKFNLKKTLEITQALYEKKLVTYPRTDSQYLPYADLKEYYVLLGKIANTEELPILRNGEKPACVKDTDAPHTAIIPTGEIPDNLSGDEKKIYDLIRDRFVTAFMIPEKYEEIIINISNGKAAFFSSRAKKVIEAGYKKINTNDEKDTEGEPNIQETNIDIESIRNLKEQIKDLDIEKKTSAKPKPYTPASLITAMMNVSRKTEDKKIKEALKEVDGLGTPATRDSFPEKLKGYGYIEQIGRNYKSTIKGKELIRVVNPKLSSAEMTGEWEIKLGKIERGELEVNAFYNEIIEFTKDIIKIDEQEILKIKETIDKASVICKCPKCDSDISSTPKVFKCKNQDCGIILYRNISGKVISEKEAMDLFQNKKTKIITGFKKKDGKRKFDAHLVIDKDWAIKFMFPEKEICPKCKSKSVRKMQKGYSCIETTCDFVIWNTIAKKKLSDKILLEIIKEGKTGKVKGFISGKTGKEFETGLKLDKDKKVVFDF